MKRYLFLSLTLYALLQQSANATGGTYINNGVLSFPPNLDYTNIINNGTMSFLINTTELPFDTSNTKNFTNNSVMIGAAGFLFDDRPSVGPPKLSANFRNRTAGTITGVDRYLGTFVFLENGNPLIEDRNIPSFVLVSATNIVNEGNLAVGASGLMRLAGTNVNLSRSGLQVSPISPVGSVNAFPNPNGGFFIPDIAIYDKYWGQTNQNNTDSDAILQGIGGNFLVTSPITTVNFHPEFPFVGVTGTTIIQLFNPISGVYTNSLGFTNLSVTNITGQVSITNLARTNIVQAVFVGLPDSANATAEVRFFNSTIPQNPFKTASVLLRVVSTNVATAGQLFTDLYVVDTLASQAPRGLYTNINSFIFDRRPQNYLVSRLAPIQYAAGFPGNGSIHPDLVYATNFVTRSVTNEFAAYSCAVDNIASRPPNIPAGTVTNLPGRIEIFADSLDVSKTRFRSEGLLNIRTRHLVNSSNAIVDCENLAYNLGSTNGNLLVQNLAQETVSRLNGTNSLWSGLWTNRIEQLIENYALDTNAPGGYALSPLTNTVEVRIHVMMMDATQMLLDVPVIVNELTTHSTNVVQNDSMTVVQSFLTDATSYTLNGGITFSNTFFTDTAGNVVLVSLESWIATNAPNLRHFTNNGNFNIPNESHFGDDRLLPYQSFVNKGDINTYGLTVDSDYADLGGSIFAQGEIGIEARSGKIEDGALSSAGDIVFYSDVLKLNRSVVFTSTRLDLTVTNSLFDAGPNSSNTITCSDGFRLLSKPATGDLLGTTFRSTPPVFASVSHVWAGINKGVTKSGYENNVAIGRLELSPQGFDPLFIFSGSGTNNGMYIDLLDLSALTDFENEIIIDLNLTIYYAAAKLNFAPAGGQTPEEYLDQRFGGRLRWVRTFVGPNSSVDAVINGTQTIKVNKALRNSTTIDSDSDGVPNYFDLSPFDGISITSIKRLTPSPQVTIGWNAAPKTKYSVEYKNALNLPWQTLFSTTNTAEAVQPWTVTDTNNVGLTQRYYRVLYNPNND